MHALTPPIMREANTTVNISECALGRMCQSHALKERALSLREGVGIMMGVGGSGEAGGIARCPASACLPQKGLTTDGAEREGERFGLACDAPAV